MAQVGTSNPPNIGTESPSSTLSPTQIDTPKADILPIAVAAQCYREFNALQEYRTTPPSADYPEKVDDEVQFIFAAPRRRKKKKRKTYEYLQHPIAQTDLTLTQSSPSNSESVRRGTTGMVQQFESYDSGKAGKEIVPGRGGSLPTVPLIFNTDPTQESVSFATSDPSNASSQLLPFSPFAVSIPWWTDPNMQLQGDSMLGDNWVPVQTENLTSKKRKHEGNFERPRPQPIQRPLASSSSSFSRATSLRNSFSGMSIEPVSIFGGNNTHSPYIPSPNITSKTPSLQDFSWDQYTNANKMQNLRRCPHPTSNSSRMNAKEQLWPNQHFSKLLSIQNPSSTGSNQIENYTQQTVRIPAAFVPDKSVSPRTQTVEVPNGSGLNRTPARQILLQSSIESSIEPTSTSLTSSFQQPKIPRRLNFNNHLQVPKLVPLQPQYSQAAQRLDGPNLVLNRPQHLRPSSSDIQRKPSLYGIPPWNSPPLATESQTVNTSTRNSIVDINKTSNSGLIGTQATQSSNPVYLQRSAARSLPKTPPVESLMTAVASGTRSLPPPGHYSLSSAPTKSSMNAATRKHSPNLIVDIAETCQENFPFAAVAERHKQPVQKVFDTFSAIIQLPLLRSASDNRRHGSLAKTRMKQYKDAKKAMEKAQEAERKRQLKEPKSRLEGQMGGLQRKKWKTTKAPDLLRAAILNNARENQANNSSSSSS